MYNYGYIKNATMLRLDISEEEAIQGKFYDKLPIFLNEAISFISTSVKPKITEYIFDVVTSNPKEGQFLIDTKIRMPEDFAGFSTGRNYRKNELTQEVEEVFDNIIHYVSNNEIAIHEAGKYFIPYYARWGSFVPNAKDTDTIDAPFDILEILPLYAVSQYLKRDDETKAAIYRNEFEVAVARLNNTNFTNSRTVYIRGDW